MGQDVAQLLTIPVSHYCEKARWALQRAGIPYQEVRHMQGFHYLYSLRWAGSLTVPVLRIGDRVLTDSTDILHWVDARTPPEGRLFPDDPALRSDVEALEDRFDRGIGVDVRRWVYQRYLSAGQAKEMIDKAAQGVPGYEAPLLYRLLPLLQPLLRVRVQGLSESEVEAGMARTRATLDELSTRLSDGRRYLCGDRFTAADLTLASLASFLVLPRQYGIELPTPDQVPPQMRTEVESFREHPTGKFILRLYAERQAPR